MIVVRWLRAFADFWIGFVVGDDWTVAATVLVALVATGGLVSVGIPGWWLVPVGALGSTVVSLRRTARHARYPARYRSR